MKKHVNSSWKPWWLHSQNGNSARKLTLSIGYWGSIWSWCWPSDKHGLHPLAMSLPPALTSAEKKWLYQNLDSSNPIQGLNNTWSSFLHKHIVLIYMCVSCGECFMESGKFPINWRSMLHVLLYVLIYLVIYISPFKKLFVFFLLKKITCAPSKCVGQELFSH